MLSLSAKVVKNDLIISGVLLDKLLYSKEIYCIYKKRNTFKKHAVTINDGEFSITFNKEDCNRLTLSFFDDYNKKINEIECKFYNQSGKVTGDVISFGSYSLSIIIPIYNAEKHLFECINSILSQTYNFEKNVQFILINDGSIDNSSDICRYIESEYPNNTVYLEIENGGVSNARNLGLEYARGKYVAFIDADDKLSPKYFEELIDALEKNSNVHMAVPMIKTFERQDKDFFAYSAMERKSTKIIDVNVTQRSISFISPIVVMRLSVLKSVGIKFDKNIQISEDVLFINTFLSKTNGLVATVPKAVYFYRKSFESSSAIDGSKTNPGFLTRVISVYKNIFSIFPDKIPLYYQKLVLYDLQWYEERDFSEEFKEIVRQLNIKNEIIALLQRCDDDVILTHSKIRDFDTKQYLYTLKHGGVDFLELKNTEVSGVYLGNMLLQNLSDVWVNVSKIEEKTTSLYFEGNFRLFSYGNKETSLDLIVIVGQKVYQAELFDTESVFDYSYYLGEKIFKTKSFRINIPLQELSKATVLYFNFLLNGEFHHLDLRFTPTSLLKKEQGCFRRTQSKIIRVHNRKECISILSFNEQNLRLCVSEYSPVKDSMSLIDLYFAKTGEYCGKRIWVIADRPNDADDNGETFFKYVLKQDDGIKKYFLIDKNSPDYNRLSKYGNVIATDSDEAYILAMYAELFITSIWELDQFYSNFNFLNSTRDFKHVFMQHGILEKELWRWTNWRILDFFIFVTSVKCEYEHITKNANYGYSSDVIKMTGLPRYDVLQNEPQKYILFAPTWRRAFGNKNYRSGFKLSNYFNCLNDFLHDTVLLETISKHGYRILWKMHPASRIYIPDFNLTDVVEITDESYNVLFKKCQILITDFSSVAFDFAYLRKPLIYYQFDYKYFSENQLKPYINYETDGLGEVVYDNYSLVELVTRYIQNGVKQALPTYRERIDKFFPFNDTDYSERLYTAITTKLSQENKVLCSSKTAKKNWFNWALGRGKRKLKRILKR